AEHLDRAQQQTATVTVVARGDESARQQELEYRCALGGAASRDPEEARLLRRTATRAALGDVQHDGDARPIELIAQHAKAARPADLMSEPLDLERERIAVQPLAVEVRLPSPVRRLFHESSAAARGRRLSRQEAATPQRRDGGRTTGPAPGVTARRNGAGAGTSGAQPALGRPRATCLVQRARARPSLSASVDPRQ